MDADKALELATKAFPNDVEFRTAYMLGLNDGYELHKEQMMKEAVEGELFKKAEYWVARNYPFAKGEEFDRLVTIYISGVAEGERRGNGTDVKEKMNNGV